MMKRYKLLFAVVGLLTLSITSCKKEENNDSKRLTHFYAACEIDNTDNKTYLSGLNMYWNTNDSVRLWGNASQGYLYRAVEGGSRGAEFVYARTGNAPIISGPYVIGYPSRYWNTKNVVSLPAIQQYVANNAKDIPQYAFVDSVFMPTNVDFYNVCGLVRLNLTKPNTSVARILIETDNYVYGNFRVNTTYDRTSRGFGYVPSLSYTNNGGKIVTLELTIPQSINYGKEFNIYIPARTYSKFKITIITDDDKTITKTANKSIVVERSKITTITLGQDDLQFDQNSLSGVFSVSSNTRVKFSGGNLQCVNSEWRFAEHQYDYLGSYNAASWDLFGWSTETTDFGMSTSTTNDDYSGSFWDWGTAINPGAASTPWRTLTDGEWTYLLSGRTNATNLWGMATITIDASTTVQGLILLPDNWTTMSPISPIPFAARGSVNANLLTLSQWETMETYGAVFLPAAGNRSGSTLASTGANGNYWTATSASNTNAYYMGFASATPSANRSGGRHTGRAVRLVQDAN